MKTFEEVENYLHDKKRKDEMYQKKQKQNDSFILQGYDKLVNDRTKTNRRTRSINSFNDAEQVIFRK
jgi:hypothetical protein